ncbi:MAG TPA: aspartate 1-decarboxylase [Planctomycetes bacterium]|nr:aspartate 1-decarboxylase [Planctomycetota bacterium]HIJ71754.1 aspartate 1-decarboxylase [Planctomycetota bacterium]
MFVKALKAKIHRATVTGAKVDYPGSIAVDTGLMEAAGILPYESVLMANVSNGARAETYIVPAEAGSGEVVVLGAAARLFNPEDIIILINFAYYTPQEAKKIKPKVVVCDQHNKIKKIL